MMDGSKECRMTIRIHVLGTDTGVGKTTVAAAIARGLRTRGVDVGVCKPFASGVDPETLPPDAAELVRASGVTDDPGSVSPVRFRMHASPWAASLFEGGGALVARAAMAVERLESLHEVLIVEGIGGIAVPLEEGKTYLDFLAVLPGTAIVVARAGLGTLNHTLLTLEALRSRGIHVAGVLLNRTGPEEDPSQPGNARGIELFGRVRALGELPFLPDGPDRLVLPDPVLDALSIA